MAQPRDSSVRNTRIRAAGSSVGRVVTYASHFDAGAWLLSSLLTIRISAVVEVGLLPSYCKCKAGDLSTAMPAFRPDVPTAAVGTSKAGLERGQLRLEFLQRGAECGDTILLLRNHASRCTLDEIRVCELGVRSGEL